MAKRANRKSLGSKVMKSTKGGMNSCGGSGSDYAGKTPGGTPGQGKGGGYFGKPPGDSPGRPPGGR